MTAELDREDFRLWLAEQEPDAIVGRARESSHCPIARYLMDRYGGWWSIGMGDFESAIGLGGGPTPKWAEDFIWAVDNMKNEITAKAALTLVDATEVAS